jgi:hypothetical protein
LPITGDKVLLLAIAPTRLKETLEQTILLWGNSLNKEDNENNLPNYIGN